MSANQPKAVALISGGLDSMLAAKVVMQQGVHVEGINFFTGFCVEGHTHAIRKKDRRRPKRNNALWVAEQLGIRLHMIDVVEEYKQIVINPEHGYGKNLNPCLDCKTFMVRKAQEWSEANGFDFIVTGEVLNQRPMSQRRECMPMVARDSGAGDRLLRPLCARHLPETLPERRGWVKRDQLLAFHGRSRKPQFELAARFGFEDYAQPAGGCCFLTDKNYTSKLEDLWRAQGEKNYELDDIMLLKVGRHLRPRPHFKLIIGREEGENKFLEGYRKQYANLRTISHMGPLALVDGKLDDEDVIFAARLTARFSQGREAERVRVEFTAKDGAGRQLDVAPLPQAEVRQSWYL
ncbi:MAG: tRNA (5-methylaminomethyl-2-thiouridylate)-methyltransferase [Gammaproteobacteria bacterium]|nr:tRNA (5-methylaminomethyl-2-thiouridylate)-methyltransferase [Gammaproteobacteria bacterium]